MGEDERFFKAIKLNLIGITLVSLAVGMLFGIALADLLDDRILPILLAAGILVTGTVIYEIGVSKRP